MEMHERIKELRKKYLKLSQETFAERLGVTRDVIGNIELNRLARPDQKLSLIKLMCKEFNVNEDWILNGNEPKFTEPNTFSLDTFINDRGGTDLEKEIIKTYFELDPEIRKAIFDHFKNKFFPQQKRNPLYNDIPDTPEELERMYQAIDIKDKKDIG